MTCASLCAAQYVPTYLLKFQKHPLFSVRETAGSIRKQLIRTGENYFYCLNQIYAVFFSADTNENSLTYCIKISTVKDERHRQTKLTKTHTLHTRTHKYKLHLKNIF